MPEEILRHYELTDEGSRLTKGLSLVERLRTQEVLERHLPSSPSRILDVGGATGVYAKWLADLGHDVLVIDVVPRHVEAARRLTSSEGRIDAQLGDARALDVDNATYDVVLLLGPLYHLTERRDRLSALREARRVARTGGLVATAAISRFASLGDGLIRERIFDDSFAAMVARDLTDGQHRNADQVPDSFTTAYFHHPDELRDEIITAELQLVELVGLEGLTAYATNLVERLYNAHDRERLLTAARAIESEPTMLGVSAHLLAVARRV